MIREPIYAAIFQYLAGLTAGGAPLFATATRQLTTWEDVPPESQPALLMQQEQEASQYVRGLPTTWTGRVRVYIYVCTQSALDPSVVPAQLLNPLLDAVEAALAPDKFPQDSDGVDTLGGLVSHMAIEGTIEIFQGDLGSEAVAVVPISFLVSP